MKNRIVMAGVEENRGVHITDTPFTTLELLDPWLTEDVADPAVTWGDVDAPGRRKQHHAIDDDVLATVANRIWVMVVGQKQIDIRLSRDELSVVSLKLRQEGYRA